jgi:hypothetical protein
MTQTSEPKLNKIIWLWLFPTLIFTIALILYLFKFTNINSYQDFLIIPSDFFSSLLKYLSSDPAHWGQFGDYLGGLLNPVIGGCTLIVAILVWRSQEQELQKTKKLLKEQISKQVFFDLLNIYQNVIDGITPHPTKLHIIPQGYAVKS